MISRAFRPSIAWITPLFGAMLVVLCVVMATVLVSARRNDFERASIEASNLSAAVTQDIAQTIGLYDLSIRGAVEGAQSPSVMLADKDLRQLILFDRAATAPFLGQILVLDDKGAIVADSRSVHPNHIDHSDQDYYRIHAHRSGMGLFVSRPLVARADGVAVLALSRRVDRPDGSFGGVVVGTIKLDYFHQLFKEMKVGPGGSLTLFRNDGTLLMREPYAPEQIGARLDPPKLFDLASRARDGEYEARSVVDGVDRLYHFHRIEGVPLVQNVGLSIADIYSHWRRRTLIVGILFALCCAVITSLAVVLSRELRLRIQAEDTLRNLAERDGLTGIANRRCFDRVMEAEWRRAMRSEQPVSLLMIDADQFKLLNDTLGHLAGDAALVRLARCLSTVVRRSSDLVARFGGEEFAVLLPETDVAGAATVASMLRTEVEKLGLPNPMAIHRTFTISIGVASMIPAAQQTPTRLVEAADEALYRAKEAGRNRFNIYRQPEVLKIAS